MTPTAPRRPPKGLCQMSHFKTRVRQRYGISISSATYRAMVRAIQTGGVEQCRVSGRALEVTAVFLERQSLRLTIWALRFVGIEGEIRAVYDKQRATLVTAHPALARTE